MQTTYLNQLRSRYDEVREKIHKAALKAGRDPASIKLIVVTKTQPVERIAAVIAAGILDLGENYAEEAVEKINSIGKLNGLRWHMIGHVQSRKADLVASKFDYVHSVDSYKLAQRLSRFAEENQRVLPILLECNVSGEESKFGYQSFDKNHWAELLPEIEKIAQLPNLRIKGLMTMPPLFGDPNKSKPYFKLLQELKTYLSLNLRSIEWLELSMGTSVDYPAAIEEGATMVRIGTAIMGSRPPKQTE